MDMFSAHKLESSFQSLLIMESEKAFGKLEIRCWMYLQYVKNIKLTSWDLSGEPCEHTDGWARGPAPPAGSGWGAGATARCTCTAPLAEGKGNQPEGEFFNKYEFWTWFQDLIPNFGINSSLNWFLLEQGIPCSSRNRDGNRVGRLTDEKSICHV